MSAEQDLFLAIQQQHLPHAAKPSKLREDSSNDLLHLAVRNHLEMQEQSRTVALQEKLQDRGAYLDIQVECAIDKLELAQAAIEKALDSK